MQQLYLQSSKTSKIYRSKTEPESHTRRFSLPIAWSLIPRQQTDGQLNERKSSVSIQLPKIKRVNLSENQKQLVSAKIIRMKKMNYDPTGCSKSAKLQKVMLRKKINRPRMIFNQEALFGGEETEKLFIKSK